MKLVNSYVCLEFYVEVFEYGIYGDLNDDCKNKFNIDSKGF
jgi:hypothetical protein